MTRSHRIKRLSRYLLPALLLTAVAVLPAISGPLQKGSIQKGRFREAFKAGEVLETETVLSMRLALNGTVANEDLPQLEFIRRERRKYRDEVVAVDADLRPTMIRRTYSIAREAMRDPGEELKQTVSRLQGKTVTIRRGAEGKTDVAVAGGVTLIKEDREEVVSDVGSSKEEFYPDRELARGDEWTVEPKELIKSFPGAEKATFKAKLVDVVRHQGHPCALIEINIKINGKLPDTPLSSEIALSGDLYYALDLQRTLSGSFQGPILAKGTINLDGIPVEVTGDGTMEITDTTRWLRIGGRPVPGAGK